MVCPLNTTFDLREEAALRPEFTDVSADADSPDICQLSDRNSNCDLKTRGNNCNQTVKTVALMRKERGEKKRRESHQSDIHIKEL